MPIVREKGGPGTMQRNISMAVVVEMKTESICRVGHRRIATIVHLWRKPLRTVARNARQNAKRARKQPGVTMPTAREDASLPAWQSQNLPSTSLSRWEIPRGVPAAMPGSEDVSSTTPIRPTMKLDHVPSTNSTMYQTTGIEIKIRQ